MVVHNIEPTYDSNSKILILGSFPSEKSREEGYFYAHSQNRFWSILAIIFDEKLPKTIKEKKTFLLKNNIALWDVIQSCNIVKSEDSSITDVKVNDLGKILKTAKIQKIYVNGREAEKLYKKHMQLYANIKALYLPSSSSANASYSLEKLIEKWKIIKEV